MQHFDPLFSLYYVKKGFIRPQMLALVEAAEVAVVVWVILFVVLEVRQY